MKKIFLIISVLIALTAEAQQIPNLSQYTQYHYSINPAVAGTSNNFPIAFCYRKLWAGIKSSPSVEYLSGHLSFLKNMGVGAKFFNYQTGPLRKSGLEATYSYQVSLSELGPDLSFGLSFLLYQYFLNKSDLNVEDYNDRIFQGSDKMVVPDANFGVYLYDLNYFVGISVPQLFNRSIDLKTDNILQQKQVRHYYLHGGYKWAINKDWELEPSLLFKFIEAGLYQIDINLYTSYKDKLTGGISFRSSDAIVFFVGYKYDMLKIGYSFDATVNRLKINSYGSHEITLQYTLNNFILKH